MELELGRRLRESNEIRQGVKPQRILVDSQTGVHEHNATALYTKGRGVIKVHRYEIHVRTGVDTGVNLELRDGCVETI